MIKYEHKIGSTVGTGVEKEVQNNFNGETQEVGMYLAMSRQASRSGYGVLAEVVKRLAWEEAEHAARLLAPALGHSVVFNPAYVRPPIFGEFTWEMEPRPLHLSISHWPQ